MAFGLSAGSGESSTRTLVIRPSGVTMPSSVIEPLTDELGGNLIGTRLITAGITKMSLSVIWTFDPNWSVGREMSEGLFWRLRAVVTLGVTVISRARVSGAFSTPSGPWN